MTLTEVVPDFSLFDADCNNSDTDGLDQEIKMVLIESEQDQRKDFQSLDNLKLNFAKYYGLEMLKARELVREGYL